MKEEKKINGENQPYHDKKNTSSELEETLPSRREKTLTHTNKQIGKESEQLNTPKNKKEEKKKLMQEFTTPQEKLHKQLAYKTLSNQDNNKCITREKSNIIIPNKETITTNNQNGQKK